MDEIDALVNELPDEIVEYISELQTEVETVTKARDEAVAQLEEVAKSADDDESDDRTPLEKALDGIEDEDARAFIVEKFEELDRLNAEREQEEIAKRDEAYIAKAREFDGIGDPEEIGKALRRLSEVSTDDVLIITKALTAAAEQVAESGTLYDEIGHSIAKSSDVEEEITTIAKSYRDANPDLDEAEARALAWERNPELYDAYVEEQRQKARR